jgi:hypothetical protein
VNSRARLSLGRGFEERKEAFEQVGRRGRATSDVKIDRYDVVHAP